MLMTHVGCVRVVGLKQIAWSNDVSMTLGFKLVESFSLPLLATVDCCMCHKETSFYSKYVVMWALCQEG